MEAPIPISTSLMFTEDVKIGPYSIKANDMVYIGFEFHHYDPT